MEGTLSLSRTESEPLTAEELCRSYAADVCRFAALMSSGPQDAEDLAQEAMLRAVRSLRSYDPARGPVGSWLWRIVANAARDAAGARQRLHDVVVRLGGADQSAAESVEDLALLRLRDQDLHRRLLELGLRDRTLLVLRYCLDLDLEHVGAAVGLSPDSAGKAVTRALARLRGRMKEPIP